MRSRSIHATLSSLGAALCVVYPAGVAGQDLNLLGSSSSLSLAADPLVTQAYFEGFELTDSVSAVGLAGGSMVTFVERTYSAGSDYLFLVFTASCQSCAIKLAVVNPATDQAYGLDLPVQRTDRVSLGTYQAAQTETLALRVGAYAEGGSGYDILAILMERAP